MPQDWSMKKRARLFLSDAVLVFHAFLLQRLASLPIPFAHEPLLFALQMHLYHAEIARIHSLTLHILLYVSSMQVHSVWLRPTVISKHTKQTSQMTTLMLET